jgi:hypothetical protein
MRRALWLLSALVIVLVAVSILVAVLRPDLPVDIPVAKGCRAQTDAGTVHLYPEQMANAATIAAVGVVRGVPDRGVVVALATAMQESSLRNLDHGHLDSIGLFQQRPSMDWGDEDQIMDPRYAAGKFYERLMSVPGWEQMRVTDAAQEVQRSGLPEAYQKWADEAQILGDALVGTAATAITCVRTGEPASRGEAAAEALADSLRADWGEVAGTVTPSAGGGLAITPAPGRGGWQIAHWLVAHSSTHNVSRVSFNDQEWTLSSGEWSTASGSGSGVVVVDVSPANHGIE